MLTTGFFLRLVFFNGALGSDDRRYVLFAEQIVRLQPFETLDHAASRLLFLVLIGIPYVVGGHISHAALANVFYSLILDVTVTVFAARTFGRAAGLVAAILMAFGGLHMVFASTVLPDTLNTLFLFIAAVLVYRAIYQQPARRWLVIGGAGLTAGLAYSCKDPGILFLPPAIAALVLLQRTPLRTRLIETGLLIGAFAAYMALEGVIYLLYTGDFFYRSTAVSQVHNAGIETLGLADFLREDWRHIEFAWSQRGLLGIPVFWGVAVMIATPLRDRRLVYFAATGLLLVSYLMLGSSSATRLLPLPVQPRYFLPATPFVAVCTAVLFESFRWSRSTGMRVLLPLATLVFALSMALPPAAKLSGRMHNTGTMKQVALVAELLIDSGRDIYVDETIYREALHFLHAKHAHLKRIPVAGPLPEGYLIVYPEPRHRVPDLSDERLSKIARLPVAMHVSLDTRSVQRFGYLGSYRPQAALLVHQNFVTPTGPDLRISEGNCSRPEEPWVQCRIVVQNRNPVWAEASELAFGTSTSSISASGRTQIGPLPGRSFVTVEINVNPPDAEMPIIRVWLDPDRRLQQEDRSNNEAIYEGGRWQTLSSRENSNS
ncbi:MAG: glycosyltransferase family 39 protein [Deltaproteobacteria bacterium]|nr:glycosyltransferase family 39 protein [Deltaproteobacteria bacterium]